MLDAAARLRLRPETAVLAKILYFGAISVITALPALLWQLLECLSSQGGHVPGSNSWQHIRQSVKVIQCYGSTLWHCSKGCH
jgi:hypothetical protein